MTRNISSNPEPEAVAPEVLIGRAGSRLLNVQHECGAAAASERDQEEYGQAEQHGHAQVEQPGVVGTA
ncbi:MAG TPA: hypothetical protein VFI46_13515 [Jiangellaceae bacterium]|nr:hypothetical protein [Jiangellaceae bacterium]